jgi:hypothetical protein
MIAMRRIIFAITIIPHVIEVKFPISKKCVWVMRHIAIPIFFARLWIDWTFRQGHVDVLVGAIRFFRHRIGDLRVNRPAWGEADRLGPS